MCCDGWDNRKYAKLIDVCPECDGEVDENGEALVGCNYSPVSCETCGARPCDESC
jgi:hypothetical protein